MREQKIIGIVLARNEDLFVERAVRHASAFCDEWIFCDHNSTDGTVEAFGNLVAELPSAVLHRIRHPRESHELLKPYCGTNTWVFGVDGDEIYDPERLGKMRQRIFRGEFDTSWQIFGNVLNTTSLANDRTTATGHLAPPCRSMTKLYNFAAIDSWEGECPERLHGGSPVFRDGFSADLRRNLHEEVSWEDSDLRCLHLCFLARSSKDKQSGGRKNIMETYGISPLQRGVNALKNILRPNSTPSWKEQKYRRGPEVTVDASPFFKDCTAPHRLSCSRKTI